VTTVNKAYSPANIIQGPCEIYLGVTPPTSAVPPVAGVNTIVLDAKGQPTVAATGQIASVAIAAGGSGYSQGDTLTIIQSGAIWGAVRVLTVSAGAVATVAVIRGGQGYAAASGLATTGGTGTGCTITIATITAGFYLGATEGPATTTLTPKFNEIKADQYSAPIAAAFVSNTGEIEFTCKEFLLVNLQKYFAGLASATYWNLSAGSTNPACDFIQIGSSYPSSAMTVPLLLVSPNRALLDRYFYWLAYRAYIKSAIQMGVNRKKELILKLKWGLILDTTRVASDMAAQFVRQV
jgi:hypothetical protein